ncbi:glycosyltransferase [Rhodobacterales bacterium LSUCC0246]|nr:glycosyltransferase [Rhodobacterales bacterium LSUCC0374]
MVKFNVVHLTHTYIPSDSRILKELNIISDLPNASVIGVGVLDRRATDGEAEIKNIKSIKLISRNFTILPSVLRRILSYFEFLFKQLFVVINERPAIIHCHDTPSLPVAIFSKFFFNASVIYDAHELESQKNSQGSMISTVTLLIEKLAWRHIDHFITVSGSILRWYERSFSKKPSSIILNSPEIGKDFTSRNNDTINLREFFNIENKKFIFLYLGMLIPGRGISSIISAFSDPKVSSHVVFVGDGPLKIDVDSASVANPNIHYHPPVPHDEVISIASSADVGICLIENISLSDFYSLPNKLFEYAFADIYVIASDFPDMASVVNEYGLGLVSDCSSASIVEAVLKVEQNGIYRSSKCLKGLSWSSQAAKLKILYEDIIRKHGKK